MNSEYKSGNSLPQILVALVATVLIGSDVFNITVE